MSSKSIILILIDLFIFFVLLRLVIGNFKEIKKCFWFLIKPDIISIVDKSFTKDFNYTYRFLFVAIIMFVIICGEIFFFY